MLIPRDDSYKQEQGREKGDVFLINFFNTNYHDT